MFNALVRPVISYGCQIWGVNHLKLPVSELNGTSYHSILPNNSLESVQTDFLRFVASVGRVAPLWMLLNEFSAQPLQVHFAKCIITFWNDMRRDNESMVAHACRSDLKLMVSGVKECWSFKVCKFLAALGKSMSISLLDSRFAAPFLENVPFPVNSVTYFWGLQLDSRHISDCLARFWRDRIVNCLTGSPRTTTIYPKMHAYVDWIGFPHSKLHTHLRAFIPRHMHVSLIRFRLGCWHFLKVNSARIGRQPRGPRAERMLLSL